MIPLNANHVGPDGAAVWVDWVLDRVQVRLMKNLDGWFSRLIGEVIA